MGCCLSAGKVTAPPVAAVAAKTPPPIEEETVKEVVVQSVSVSVPLPVPEPDPIPVADIVPTAPEPRNPPPSLPTPEISHNNKSDTCSVSHSFSTATTATAASILEDDAVSKPHRHPPPSTSRRNMSERISRSPGGRHSPQGKLRPRMVRERQQHQPLPQNPTHSRRKADSGPLPRTGLQEGPRRRSRSPATRAPSSSRRSPMKKREPAPEKDGAEEAKVTVNAKKEEEKVAVEVTKKEEDEKVAVKDPEVSMECFIFL